MITQLETELDRTRRIRHAPRVAYAAACLLRECGYRVTTAKPLRPRVGRATVYTIDGVPGECVGQRELRDKLWDLGHKTHAASLAYHFRQVSDGVIEVGGFTIRTVGVRQKARAA